MWRIIEKPRCVEANTCGAEPTVWYRDLCVLCGAKPNVWRIIGYEMVRSVMKTMVWYALVFNVYGIVWYGMVCIGI